MHEVNKQVRTIAPIQDHESRFRSEPDKPPVGAVLQEIATDATALVRDEVALVLRETRDRAKAAITAFAIGTATGLAALLMFCAAVYFPLARAIGDWQATLLLGGVLAIVSMACLFLAVKRLEG